MSLCKSTAEQATMLMIERGTIDDTELDHSIMTTAFLGIME